MHQMYYCPNCRASVCCGARFCGSCGIRLDWVVQPGWQETQARNLRTFANKESASGELGQFQQQHVSGNRSTVSRGKSSSQDTAVTPISVEISKLLTDFFSRHRLQQ